MEIVKKKVFYTSFAALMLSGFTLQTTQADEVELSTESTAINLVSKESENAVTLPPVIEEGTSAPAVQVSSQTSPVSVLSEAQTSALEGQSQLQASLTTIVSASEASLSYSQSTLMDQVALASSEVQVIDDNAGSEQAKPDIVLTIARTRQVTSTESLTEVTATASTNNMLYTSELSGITPNSVENSEAMTVGSLALGLDSVSSSELVSFEEVKSETAENLTEGLSVLTVGWADSTSTSDVFETSEVVSLVQSESKTYASEVMTATGETTQISATPISAEVYTIVPKRDSTGAKVETSEVVEGNKDVIYLARGEVLNVNFDVNKMNGTKIKGLNLVLDGKKIHHSFFIEGTLDDINAGLSAYHLAEQTTGIHQMGFELIDTDDNIHYLTQTFSVFNDGERPVTPVSPSAYQPTVFPTSDTSPIAVTYNYSDTNYTEVATRIQATAVSELAETTRSLTQQLASQIAEVLSSLSHAVSGSGTAGTTPIDIFQAASHGVTQAAKKIAEAISDPEVVGKQALAAATVALVLLVLYLAAITFI